jgi:hypothetical protein
MRKPWQSRMDGVCSLPLQVGSSNWGRQQALAAKNCQGVSSQTDPFPTKKLTPIPSHRKVV